MFHFKFRGTFALLAILNLFVDNCSACVSVFDARFSFGSFFLRKSLLFFQTEYHLILKIDSFPNFKLVFFSNPMKIITLGFWFRINIEWIQNAFDIGRKLRRR